MASFLDPFGQNNPLTGQIENYLSQAFPGTVPEGPSFSIGAIGRAGADGAAPTEQMLRAIISGMEPNGGPGYVPWASEMDDDFSTILGNAGLSYIDASVATTAEQPNDMIYQTPFMVTPYDDGSETQFTEKMPIFSLKPPAQRSEGFTTVASLVMINNMQQQLQKLERDARLSVAGGGKYRALMPYTDVNAPREVVIVAQNAYQQTRIVQQRARSMVTDPLSQKLETLRHYAALSVNELNEKIAFMGPITQIWNSKGPDSSRSSTSSSSPNQLLINTSYHVRGQIKNVFSTHMEPGDAFYFKIAKFPRERISQVSVPNGVARNLVGNKRRALDDDSYVVSPAISQRSSDADNVVQIRGFSSTSTRQFMGDTSELEDMKPRDADRFFIDREHRVALEWREFIADPDTGLVKERALLDQEGEQEVREAVPSIVYENYMSAGIIIPVGTCKTGCVPLTEEAILNAHFDHSSLDMLPHFDFFHNRCT